MCEQFFIIQKYTNLTVITMREIFSKLYWYVSGRRWSSFMPIFQKWGIGLFTNFTNVTNLLVTTWHLQRIYKHKSTRIIIRELEVLLFCDFFFSRFRELQESMEFYCNLDCINKIVRTLKRDRCRFAQRWNMSFKSFCVNRNAFLALFRQLR